MAEDLTADTFVRLMEHRPAFFHPLQERRWLLTTASRLFTDARRRDHTVPVQSLDASGPPLRDSASSTIDRLWIRHLVSRLSPAQQDVVRYRFLDDLTHDQIAARLGISPEAVRSRLHRALQDLRRLMAQEDLKALDLDRPGHRKGDRQ